MPCIKGDAMYLGGGGELFEAKSVTGYELTKNGQKNAKKHHIF
jgi:hypothetical protein